MAVANRVPEWTVGDRIKKARESAQMGQVELVDALVAQGILASQVSLSGWERGRQPRNYMATIRAIAQATGVDETWILTGRGKAMFIDSSTTPDLHLRSVRSRNGEQMELSLDVTPVVLANAS